MIEFKGIQLKRTMYVYVYKMKLYIQYQYTGIYLSMNSNLKNIFFIYYTIAI